MIGPFWISIAAITLLRNEGIPIEHSSDLTNKNILDQRETKQKWYGAQSVVATSLAIEVARRRAQWSKVSFYRKKHRSNSIKFCLCPSLLRKACIITKPILSHRMQTKGFSPCKPKKCPFWCLQRCLTRWVGSKKEKKHMQYICKSEFCESRPRIFKSAAEIELRQELHRGISAENLKISTFTFN